MSDISSGLQTYGLLKTYLGLFVCSIVLCCACFFTVSTFNAKYQLASNSVITYKSVEPNGTITNINCPLSDDNCQYIDEYDVNNVHYQYPEQIMGTREPELGPTNIYYKEADPKSYVKSAVTPYYIPLGISVFVSFIICIMLIQIHFISTNKEYGAVVGGISAFSDVASIFNRK